MLSKTDLSQIKNIVDASITRETTHIVQQEFTPIKEDVGSLRKDIGSLRKHVTTLRDDVSALKEDVTVLKNDASSLKKDLKSLKKDMRYVKKTTSVIVSFFNKEDMEIIKRVRRIEDHLRLSI